MHLNADFSQRAVVHSARMPWTPSPINGVDRRMLDRIGGEVARATSIVRYAPHSHFPPHTHGGGEEFLVLKGVFQDEHGDYPAGSYVRNPPGSRHTPASEPGCVLFVKLWQFRPSDRARVHIDTAAVPFVPAAGRPHTERIALFSDDREEVRLERWIPHARMEIKVPGGIEIFVLDGQFTEHDEELTSGSWLRLPAAATLVARAGSEGCKVWVKSGHLAHMSPFAESA